MDWRYPSCSRDTHASVAQLAGRARERYGLTTIVPFGPSLRAPPVMGQRCRYRSAADAPGAWDARCTRRAGFRLRTCCILGARRVATCAAHAVALPQGARQARAAAQLGGRLAALGAPAWCVDTSPSATAEVCLSVSRCSRCKRRRKALTDALTLAARPTNPATQRAQCFGPAVRSQRGRPPPKTPRRGPRCQFRVAFARRFPPRRIR